ncbi:acyl CoA:acetate/3-ketoacid CoA transferase [Ulvibacterium marinum]|uniref:Acyl CoA:acetate/3-ketoacid CoA transferase n=1 Tax=Ulvibacterium marinum TaxID=2419782 RepID=A0A3B0CFG3_9FLAO|nr:CoA-transferase [Ulvibacterium marinum]RKN83444.1 acyl CoA:acetate/3-ketoacid CoA transferase [Ulvibacterium marinum]
MFKIIDANSAVQKIRDGDSLAIGGAGAGHAVPDRLLQCLGERYALEGHPKKLTTIHPCGIGDNDKRGLNHLAQEGLIDTDFGGFWGNAPKMCRLAKEHKIKGYNLPQGVLSHLMRASASKKPGIITKVGLHTFVDPRVEGGKINDITTQDWVRVMQIDGEEYLFYKSFKIDVAFIRGTSIDSEGNITMEEEVGSFSMLSIAQAARTNGGIVIAQVRNIERGHSDPGHVKVPGNLIDFVVHEPEQEMTFLSKFDAALVKRNVEYTSDELQLHGPKRVIIRRAALELKKRSFVNLGYGMSDGVPIVAEQEKIVNDISFMIEQGASGGIPTTGLNFGAMYNPSSIVDDGYQFDFFQGGGLDIAFLGFAQIDKHGNVNSSRFGNVLTGCGGFIDISQNAKKVVLTGTFAVKSNQEVTENGIVITRPGKFKKFVDQVEQITFSGDYARENGQEILYVTERAVFKMSEKGLELIEIAPGVDLQKDILDMMEFEPIISKNLKTIDNSVYQNGKTLNLKQLLS